MSGICAVASKEVDTKIRLYSGAAYQNDIDRLRDSWRDLQKCRARDGVYEFLVEVFDLVSWWLSNGRLKENALSRITQDSFKSRFDLEPFSAAIIAAAFPTKLDKRTVSKWARVLRLAHEHKPQSQKLTEFIKDAGGLNKCASLYARRLGRHSKKVKSRKIKKAPISQGQLNRWEIRARRIELSLAKQS
jgi:hypothetical protein